MIHLQNDIKDVLEKKLKASTDELDLRVSLYNSVLPSDFTIEEDIANSYKTNVSKYINGVIADIRGDWIEVPDTNIMNADVILNLQVPTMEWHEEPGRVPIEEVLTQDVTEKVFKMLDTFRRNYSSIPLPVGDSVWQLLDEGVLTFEPPVSIDTVDEIEFSARFIDNQYKVMIESGNFVISKENGVLSFIYNNTTVHSFEYDKKEYYTVSIKNGATTATITVNGEETDIGQDLVIPSELKLYEFGGYIEYLGVNSEVSSDGSWTDVLIENFDTLENKAVLDEFLFQPGPEIDNTGVYRYGANEFGKQGVMTFGITTPSPVTQQYTFGDQSCLYQQFEVVLGVTYAEDIFTGNHYRYFLEGEEISPFSMSHSFAPEPESNQTINGNTTQTVNRTNTIGHSLTLYHGADWKVNQIIRQALRRDNEQNKEINLTIQYPNFKEVYSLVNTQLGTSPVINSMATVSFDIQPRHKFE